MSYFDDRKALIHYGIPGQKPGVNRYYDENGNLTEEGKRRLMQKKESFAKAAANKQSSKSKIAPRMSNTSPFSRCF